MNVLVGIGLYQLWGSTEYTAIKRRVYGVVVG
jgi:hypothetical protein